MTSEETIEQQAEQIKMLELKLDQTKIALKTRFYNFLLGDSWRTSALGYAFSVALILNPIVQAHKWPTAIQLVQAALMAALGRKVTDESKAS